MPIEFDCPQCHHRLRTPDGTEGRTAVCPNCSQQVTIPSQTAPQPPAGENPSAGSDATQDDSPIGSAEASSPFGESPERSADAFNPYAAPSTETAAPQEGTVAELKPTRTTASEILTVAWETFRENLTPFILLGLVLMAIFIGGYIIGMVFGMMAAFLGAGNQAIFWACQTLGIVWGQIYGTFLSAVGIRYALSVTAGNQEPMQGAFNVLPYYLRMLFAQLLIVLLAYAAALVCCAPILLFLLLGNDALTIFAAIIFGSIALVVAVYITLRMSLASTFIIDRNQGITESISSSAAYTKGNAGAIFLAFLVIGIVMLFVVALTCGLGVVIAYPYQFMTIVLIYRLVTGQGTGGQSPFAQD